MTTINHSRLILILLGFLVIMAGCLPDTPTVPNRISLSFLVDGMGGENGTISSDGNTLVVNEIKMYLGRYILGTPAEARLESNQGAILRFQDTHPGVPTQIFAGQIGYEDLDTFNDIEIFVAPPPDSVSVPDSDLVNSGERYSIIIKGTYNDSTFTFESKGSLNPLIEFSQVSLSADRETLSIEMMTDIRDFMLDPQEGGIISPIEPDNNDRIVNLIEEAIRVEVTAESTSPVN